MTVAMSFVASFGYSAPVWNAASPESFAAASRALPVSASAARNVKLFFGLLNALSNACLVMLTSPSSGFCSGGS